MLEYIKLLRIKHYIKNLLVFIPLFFSGLLLKANNFLIAIVGFICFCLVASSVYIINDIKDKESDSKHEIKKNRPIASGKVSIPSAILELFLLLIICIVLIILFKFSLGAILLLSLYLVLNIGYSLWFKKIPILDITIIAFGFVIRVLYGAQLFDISVSSWLYLTILTISFYLALGKRRNEITKIGDKARSVLNYYSKEFLDKNMYVCLTMALIFYSLWTIENNVSEYSGLLIWTIPLVLVISMKYSFDIEKNNFGDPTEIILNDKIIIILSMCLCVIVFLILYL